MINIANMNKAEVLAALYNASKPQGMGYLQYDPKPMTTEEAQRLLDEGFTYFDYLKGRVMKVDLSGDMSSTLGCTTEITAKGPQLERLKVSSSNFSKKISSIGYLCS